MYRLECPASSAIQFDELNVTVSNSTSVAKRHLEKTTNQLSYIIFFPHAFYTYSLRLSHLKVSKSGKVTLLLNLWLNLFITGVWYHNPSLLSSMFTIILQDTQHDRSGRILQLVAVDHSVCLTWRVRWCKGVLFVQLHQCVANWNTEIIRQCFVSLKSFILFCVKK